MQSFGFFLLQLVLLFFLSQELTKHISKHLFSISKNKNFVIYFLSFLFLPGVILHELAHLLIASVLMVPTGEVEFLPQMRGNEVKLGSVAIGQTDIVRRFFIGVAPLVCGLGVLLVLFLSFYPFVSLVSWQSAIFLYSLFEIGNTMFSSRKDMEGALGFFILVCLVVLLAFFSGFKLSLANVSDWFGVGVVRIFTTMDLFLLAALVIDMVCILGLFLVGRIFKKVTYKY